jgi:photosystem II stability/assembly factor-like uncharacterized protein
MLGWLTALGLGLLGTAAPGSWPAGAEMVPVPSLPVRPISGDMDARGTCAVISTDLGFLALTTDEGQSFRFVRTPTELLDRNAKLHCAGDRFFITRGAELFSLVNETWSRVGPAPSPSESKFRGVVQAPGALFVGTGSHVLASRDGGGTFAPVFSGTDALVSNGKEVILAKGKEVYAVGASEALTLMSKLTDRAIALAFVEADLFAATERRLFRSEDGGKTWKPVSGAPAGIAEMSAFGTNLIVKTASDVRARDAKGRWSKLDTIYRARPGASRLWLNYGGGYLGRVARIGDAPTPESFPKDPMPTVRALAANGRTLVVALYRPMSVHVSADAGRTWQSACPGVSVDRAVLDGVRLQLAGSWSPGDAKKCLVPGLKTRFVPKLPEETCKGGLCVRFVRGSLLRTRDRGKTWQDLTANLGGKPDVVAAAASGREIIVARRVSWVSRLSSIQEYTSLFRSIDDGRSFTPLNLPFLVTAFTPGDDGWFFGTHLYGVVRLPYAAHSTAPPASPNRR